MDRSLKERLVGAAVLVAIGAWLIPWVLDGPERVAAPESAALTLPSPDIENPPSRTETIVLDRRDSPVALEPQGPTASTDTPAPTPSAAPRPQSAPPSRERVEATEQPPSEPVAASPAAADAAPAAPAEGTRWYVQLGAFGDRANAERLAARVGTYGYQAHVSDFASSGRTVHRVRVGPEPSRARAEAIASALSAHSFVAQVVPQ